MDFSFSNNLQPYAAQTAAAASTSNTFSHLSPLHAKIMKIVQKSDSTNEGTVVYTIIGALRNESTEQQIRDALDWLCTEGHLYQTVDDDHYKTVEV
jgi:replication factor A2